jgi:uracil-DNA glycosylase family 4
MQKENIKVNDKIWLSGFGNDEGKIMIIVSNPTYEDLRHEELLVNLEDSYTARDEIFHALEMVGIDPDDCWFTSIVKYGIGSKDKPTADQIEECAKALDEEIAEVKPKLIVTLGAECFKRIMKQNIKQSDYIGEIIDCPYGKVMANYSPANVYRVDPKLRNEFVENFELVKRFVNDQLKYDEFKWIVVDDPAVNAEIIKSYMADNKWIIGYDAEWKGKLFKGETMYTFQYSCEPNKAIVLPIIKADKTENLELLNTMKPFLENPKAKRVGWNIRADDKRLVIRGFNIPDETLHFDGMKAMAFFDSRYSKGLEVGIKKFTNYKPYYNKLNRALRDHKIAKEDMSELFFKEPDIFIEYCAGDAVSHREACIRMAKELPNVTHKSVSDYYFKTYLPLTSYIMDMELTGLPIDIECMEKLTKQYNECYNLLYDKLMTITKKYRFDTVEYNKAVLEYGEADAIELGYREDFNPRSHHDKVELFFNKLKLTPVYYVKKGKAKPKTWWDTQRPAVQKQYSPSANGKSIASIRFKLAEQMLKDKSPELAEMFEAVQIYLDMNRVGVFANKFLSTKNTDAELIKLEVVNEIEAEDAYDNSDEEGGDPLKSSYWGALCPDNRIHADFFECLNNFRSSSRVNVQNPASKVLSHIPDIFNRLKLTPPDNIRNIFYSGHPDWYFAEVDVAGADLAIAAFLSGDQKYIADIRKGGFHATKMKEYFKDNSLTKDDYSKYVTAKAITFRVSYTAGLMSAALPIQAEIYAESGNLVDIEVINYALNTWNKYETYMEYRDQCQHQVDNEQCIVNARGMRFNFGNTKDFAIKAGWYNQSLAYPIASELALFLWDVSVRIKEQMKKDGVWIKLCKPVNTVHDAAYWLVHKDLLKDGYFPELARRYFTKEVKIATGDNLGIEMVISDRWKSKNKIFSKETKWDPKLKEWVW